MSVKLLMEMAERSPSVSSRTSQGWGNFCSKTSLGHSRHSCLTNAAGYMGGPLVGGSLIRRHVAGLLRRLRGLRAFEDEARQARHLLQLGDAAGAVIPPDLDLALPGDQLLPPVEGAAL